MQASPKETACPIFSPYSNTFKASKWSTCGCLVLIQNQAKKNLVRLALSKDSPYLVCQTIGLLTEVIVFTRLLFEKKAEIFR